MRSVILLVSLILAGCGEPVQDDHFARDVKAERPAIDQAAATAVPVRVGELGPSFDACGAAGTTRHVRTALPVRSAPFDTAEQKASLTPGQRFFVCSRTLDQKWFGIVFDPAAGLADSCGVSAPVTSVRPYQGQCESGWVASAFVKLIAGNDVASTDNSGDVDAR